ncbi:hypothetical protein HYH03_015935 [Edaphochlamys debaryana]|uniref:Uncharacterized protein n=1 Tax=Edaphochlamys debaryana TaxID=47281 RepID=A0A835XKW2_9CHLO|nr:hypothetical protein HYH03_015935 [Edaphochlamys debaryana]|eukprot:KAG2485354.1 hypothetical protein HYH03_015935 [Edaphochlamys debaryana]
MSTPVVTYQTAGEKQLASNVVDVTLILLGALLLPIYLVVYRFNEHIFNMMQCTHIMVVSLFAVLYVNLIKKECFGANEVHYRAFNLVFVYTMFLFFLMFLFYIIMIFMDRKK